MTFAASKSLIEQQVDLVRAILALRSGMAIHLKERVMPHLDPDARAAVRHTIEFLVTEEDVDVDLLFHVEIALEEVRKAIAAGTSEERVPIPRARLIVGSAEAYDVRRVVSPEAEALTAALPPLSELFTAVKAAINFAEAVRLSIEMLSVH